MNRNLLLDLESFWKYLIICRKNKNHRWVELDTADNELTIELPILLGTIPKFTW